MFAVSELSRVVTIVAAPGSAMAWIRRIGTVKMGAETALDVAIDRVQKLAPRPVVIDLANL